LPQEPLAKLAFSSLDLEIRFLKKIGFLKHRVFRIFFWFPRAGVTAIKLRNIYWNPNLQIWNPNLQIWNPNLQIWNPNLQIWII
jgi:hypothetical protein